MQANYPEKTSVYLLYTRQQDTGGSSVIPLVSLSFCLYAEQKNNIAQIITQYAKFRISPALLKQGTFVKDKKHWH